MNWRRVLAVEVVAALTLSTLVSMSRAGAEPKSLKEQLVGTWTFVSSVNTRKDGSKFDSWGANPAGIFMFDPDGHYAQVIMRSEVGVFGPKTVFSFGTYSVDEKSRTLVTHIQGSSLARLNGTEQRRIILTLTGDELRYVNTSTASGNTVEALWKRSKHP